jgi:hypothetical protein
MFQNIQVSYKLRNIKWKKYSACKNTPFLISSKFKKITTEQWLPWRTVIMQPSFNDVLRKNARYIRINTVHTKKTKNVYDTTLPNRNFTLICIPWPQKLHNGVLLHLKYAGHLWEWHKPPTAPYVKLNKIHSAYLNNGDATSTLCIHFMGFIQTALKLMEHSRGVT